jgi:hypothetical protein
MAEQLVGLLIFALYFLSIFVLFSFILQSISERRRASGRGNISWFHVNLAFVSFVFTWYCECLSCVCGFTDTSEAPDEKI